MISPRRRLGPRSWDALLSKIARLHMLGERLVQAPEAVAFDAGDAVIFFQPALDDQQRAGEDGPAVFLEGAGGDDDVGYAGLVFQAEEDEALCGARPPAGGAEAAGAEHP